jgi:tRNA wybutosine-synthesizing protein 2
VENLVEPILGDCAIVTPEGVADRVIMGYVGTTHHYLPNGIKALKPEGGILHYHETTPEKLLFERPVNRIQEAALQLGKKMEIIGTRRIKKYAPGVWHVVVDARIT